MNELNAFMEMCAGSLALAFFVMLLAANIGRLIKFGIGEGIED